MVAGDLAGSSDSNLVISISGTSPINITPNALQWAISTTIPILGQIASATAAGQALTIQAQGSTGSGTNGGNLVLASGASASGTAGSVQLQSGIITNLSLTSTGSLQFGSTITSPTLTQATASAAGGNLSITAQSAGGTTNNGGSLVLTSGSSSTTGISGNVTINTATPGGGGTAGNILFQVSGTTQAFVTTNASGAGFGIGSTPGTSPTITSGTGTPSSTEPNGSLYLNVAGSSSSVIYTRQNGTWASVSTAGIQIIPLTETITTNSSHSIYTVDSTGGGSDGIILHNYTASTTGYTYIMPAPTAGRQIIIRDITGGIETANTGGYITGTGTSSKVIFIAPHAVESFNGSSGYALSGSAFHFTNNSATVTATSSLFTTELAPGMSIVPVGGTATTTASYIISSISNATTLTLTTNYTGNTSTAGTATMNSLAYYANYGTLTLISNGTNWFASSNKPLRAYITGSTGTFIPSPGSTSATLIGCGGGGGGANNGGVSSSTGGGGGGALQSVINTSITPNTAYSITIGAGGGNAGGTGGITFFGSSATFNGGSGGGGGAGGTCGSGGYPVSNGSATNIYSDALSGLGVSSIAAATAITPTNMPGMMGMGAGSFLAANTPGFNNIMGNGSYSGGTTNNGGGGGAGPQGNGGNGASAGTGGSAAANSGAGGGGNYSTPGSAGAGGSGYLYILMPM